MFCFGVKICRTCRSEFGAKLIILQPKAKNSIILFTTAHPIALLKTAAETEKSECFVGTEHKEA